MFNRALANPQSPGFVHPAAGGTLAFQSHISSYVRSIPSHACSAAGALALSALIAAQSHASSQQVASPLASPPTSNITYADHVAAIINARCVTCHAPYGAAPFSLETFADVKKRARLIAEVVQRRYMPPWLPEPEHGEFAHSRRLSDQEINTIVQWVERGAIEGQNGAGQAQVKAAPRDGWSLGEPDIVLSMSEPYLLRPDGRDVFRNFVLSTDIDAPRYVRAVEFQIGNPRVVHHANLKIDRRQAGREADARDEGPGFDGVDFSGAEFPDGHILGWTPGKFTVSDAPDMAWRLDPGVDLILMLHMLPRGKPEPIQVSVALYFSSSTPTKQPYSLRLGSQTLDIPAGDSAYTIVDDYVLPVDVEATSIYPHAHYLGREISAWAVLPDERIERLLLIRRWDFKWQDEYRYVNSVSLPKGTRIHVRMTYDNSAANPDNPHHPPQRVVYGPKSSDEMADVWIQVLPRRPEDLKPLIADFSRKELASEIASHEQMLRLNPNSPELHEALAERYIHAGRIDHAITQLKRCIELDPNFATGHCNLGVVYQSRGDLNDAIRHFQRAVECDPSQAQAHLNLGLALETQGSKDAALKHLRRAVELKPKLPAAHVALADALRSRGILTDACEHYRRATELCPDDAVTRHNFGITLMAHGDLRAAAAEFNEALRINPAMPETNSGLARLLHRTGNRDAALKHYLQVLQHKPGSIPDLGGAAWILSTHPDPSIRNPAKALDLAEKAATLTNYKDAAVLDVLAVAYAASGDFGSAVKAEESALKIARTGARQATIDEFANRLRMFQQGRAYIESALPQQTVGR